MDVAVAGSIAGTATRLALVICLCVSAATGRQVPVASGIRGHYYIKDGTQTVRPIDCLYSN